MPYKTIIVANRKELDDFLNLPFRIYRNDPAWVAPLRTEVARVLDTRKNPYFRGVDLQLFVCYREGQPVARGITVINPRHGEKFGRKTAFFGFFESENDAPGAQHLFDSMEKYCAGKGAEYLEGPFNPNHYSELGLLVRNFDPPAFFEPYNPEYYAALLLASGFKPVLQLHSRIIRNAPDLAGRSMPDVSARVKAAGYTIRPFRLCHLRSDLERIREVFNDAFTDNWYFLPLSREEYLFSAQSLFLVTNPSLIQIVEHHGKPVGVLQMVLNVNPILAPMKGRRSLGGLLRFIRQRFAVREVVLYAIGVKKEYRRSVVFKLLLDAFYRLAQRYRVAYCTWMSDANTAAVTAADHAGFIPYKWFEIYGKPINEPN